MALARHEMRDGDQLAGRPRRPAGREAEVRAEMHDARVAGSQLAAAGLRAVELASTSRAAASAPRTARSPAADSRATASTSPPCTETTSGVPMRARRPRRPPARRSARARGSKANRRRRRRRASASEGRPTPPSGRKSAAAGARGTARTVTSMPSSSARSGWRSGLHERRGPARAHGGQRGHRPVQHEHAHVGPGVTRGQRLPVRPYPEDRVERPRVVLRDDRDARHRYRCSATVSAASARVT
jgi:hypothetical protein